MRLTKRCLKLLKLLQAARWLATSQIHRRFFAHATKNAARKRLRKLTVAGYIRRFQQNHMTEALFTLGPEGKRVLEQRSGETIPLERRPPKQLDHLAGINDVRIAAELAGPPSYFFACWELPGLGWNHPIIPDAVFAVGGKSYVVEFDRGLESVRYFLRNKITFYRQGFTGFPITKVLVVADRKARMESLARSIADERERMLYTTIDLVRKQGIRAPIFYSDFDGEAVPLV